VFLETGARALKSRVESGERGLTLARTKIGKLMMRLGDEWKKSKL
jgi:hypothetical protein